MKHTVEKEKSEFQQENSFYNFMIQLGCSIGKEYYKLFSWEECQQVVDLEHSSWGCWPATLPVVRVASVCILRSTTDLIEASLRDMS